MFRFLFLALFVAIVEPNPGLRGGSLAALPSSRSFDLREICKRTCTGHSDYFDYDYSSRSEDTIIQPRFLCSICIKKYGPGTTTKATTTTMKPTVSPGPKPKPNATETN